MILRTFLLLMLPGILATCGATDAFDAAAQRRIERELFARPLRSAGIDPNDSVALVQVILSNRSGMAVEAIFALRYLPATPQVVSVLKSQLASGDEMKLTSAARSLNELGVHDWPPLVAGRLASMKNPLDLYSLTADLAEAGDFSGWPYVRDAIADAKTSDGMFAIVTTRLYSYYQMPGTFGPRLALAHELHELLPRLPEGRKALIEREINRVQSSAAVGVGTNRR
jgi:hypothetical protein